MKKSFIYGMLSAGIMLQLSSCASKDVYNAEEVEINQRETYSTNFVKKYGPINSNQTWDFTENKVRLGTRAVEDITIETVAGLDFGVTESLDENNKVVTTITKNLALYNDVPMKLPDGKKHTGESAILIAPSNDFYIYPISCQGSWKHDFCVRVGDAEPVKIYNKFWTDFSKPYVNGMATNSSVKDGEINVTKRAEMPGVHISAPTGTPVEVYLDKVNNGSSPMVSTVTGSAIVIDTEVKPEGVPIQENSVVQYIGIEDRYDYDFDYNDMVMVVIGNPDTPPTEKIVNDQYNVVTNISKRYMIEDLGATDDFDFNDIVVDVIQNTTEKHRRTYKVDANGEKTELISDIITGTTNSQKATIRHLGGILPFILKVGNTTFEEMAGQLNVDVEITKNVSGWNPSKNNVSISVLEKDGKYYDIAFPKAGDVPMIIAVDINQNWMPERQSVPADCFYLPE